MIAWLRRHPLRSAGRPAGWRAPVFHARHRLTGSHQLTVRTLLVARANSLATAAGTGAVVAMARSYRLAVSGYAAAGYLTTLVDGRPRIVDRPPLVTHLEDDDPLSKFQVLRDRYTRSLRADVHELLNQYTPVDAARKVVGIGSIGTRCLTGTVLGYSIVTPTGVERIFTPRGRPA
jgi:hypothetical protein